MIHAIIIEDEQHCIDHLQSLLLHHKNLLKVEGSFTSVEDGIKALKQLKPGLIFLDVQINDKTCFDLLKQIDNINFEIIFTTAYDRFALQAFKFSAIDYLLKPVDADDLSAALEKLSKKISANEMKQKLDLLFSNMQKTNMASKKIAIPTTTELVFISVCDIIRCQSDINYTTIFLKDKQKLVVAKTLKEFEELLSKHNFFRIHNSHLINLAYIKSYNKGNGGSALLTDGTELEVSTRRKDDFLEKLAAL